jgi:hypothetical protein
MFSGGKVLTQLTDYLVEDKARKRPFPYHLFVPAKGKPGVDYFRLHDLSDLPALFNYAMVSVNHIQAEVMEAYMHPDASWTQLRALVHGYATTGKKGGEDIVIWPSVYWAETHSMDLLVFPLLPNGEPAGDPVPLGNFQPFVTKGIVRGYARDFATPWG